MVKSFVNKLGEVWHLGLNEKNIVSGFANIGIFPVNREMFSAERFDERILKRYHAWVEAGRPDDDLEKLAFDAPGPISK